MQHIQLEVFDGADCENLYQQLGELATDRQLCLGGEEGKDSCAGDSGSALMEIHPTRMSNNQEVITFIQCFCFPM